MDSDFHVPHGKTSSRQNRMYQQTHQWSARNVARRAVRGPQNSEILGETGAS